MATIPTVASDMESAEELARRNRAGRVPFVSWETEGDEHEQRARMAALREALGSERLASSRPLYP